MHDLPKKSHGEDNDTDRFAAFYLVGRNLAAHCPLLLLRRRIFRCVLPDFDHVRDCAIPIVYRIRWEHDIILKRRLWEGSAGPALDFRHCRLGVKKCRSRLVSPATTRESANDVVDGRGNGRNIGQSGRG